MMTAAVRAVLFDLDGTLIDSEGHYYHADKAFLADYGIDFTDDMHRAFVGRGADELFRLMREEFGVREDGERLLRRKNEHYLSRALGNTRVFPEMKKLLEELMRRRLPMAVASGSPRVVIDRMLEHLDLRRYFQAVTSSEEVGRGKPAPDVFLEAARRLRVPAEHCVVVEDSLPGVRAAKAAGMRVMAVPTCGDEGFAMADLLFPAGMGSFHVEEALAWLDAMEPCRGHACR